MTIEPPYVRAVRSVGGLEDSRSAEAQPRALQRFDYRENHGRVRCL